MLLNVFILHAEVMFQLRGQFYSSHSILDPSTISIDTSSLFCITTTVACCQSTHTGTGMGAGQLYFPNGTEVLVGPSNPLYMTRGASIVRLNRASSATTPSGLYRCEVPVTDSTESVYIGLYTVGQGWLCECLQCVWLLLSLTGAPTITEDIKLSREDLSLTCLSSGGPVRSVEWTRDGVTITTGYSVTQTLTNVATATYANILRASNISDLVGNFTCTVSNGREPSNTRQIMLNGEYKLNYTGF